MKIREGDRIKVGPGCLDGTGPNEEWEGTVVRVVGDGSLLAIQETGDVFAGDRWFLYTSEAEKIDEPDES